LQYPPKAKSIPKTIPTRPAPSTAIHQLQKTYSNTTYNVLKAPELNSGCYAFRRRFILVFLPQILQRRRSTEGWHIDEGPNYQAIVRVNLVILLSSGVVALVYNLMKNDFNGAVWICKLGCYGFEYPNGVFCKWRQERILFSATLGKYIEY
jgi:hypothetical protein